MVARVTYRRADGEGEPSGNAVTLVEGAPAELAYRRDPRWLEVGRDDVDTDPEPERLKPAERAEARAAAIAAEAAASVDPEVIASGNVGAVKAAVTAGGPGLAAAVLEVERAGRNRSSLVGWLIGQAGDDLDAPAPAEAPAEPEPAGKPGVEFADPQTDPDPEPEPEPEPEPGQGDGEDTADGDAAGITY